MPDTIAVLFSSVSEARDAALANLQRQQAEDGSWRCRFDLYAFPAALHIILLRTTGLIERSGSLREEVDLARHLCSQTNPDGGFYKFPGSPSSWSVTKVAHLALRLVLGDIAGKRRPAVWFRRNEELKAEAEAGLLIAAEDARRYLAAHPRAWRFFELDHLIFARLLEAHVLCEKPAGSLFFLPHLWLEALARHPRLNWLYSSFSRLWRATLPAIVILFLTACRWPRRGKTDTVPKQLSKRERDRIDRLVRLIRARQNENGGWFFNAVFPMFDVMALVAAGVANDDPAILLAHEHLRGRLFPAAQGGLAVNVMDTDVWNTAHGLHSLAGAAGGPGLEVSIRSALAYLLSAQNPEGGFAWGKGFARDIDNDSTAFALRALAKAERVFSEPPLPELGRAICRGRNFLVSRRNRNGGWSVWEKTFFGSRAASLSILGQIALDRSTPDQTARALEGLAMSGLSLADGPVRRALRFLLRSQCRDGSWWSRWWAGYIPGIAGVLMALAALGMGSGSGPPPARRCSAACGGPFAPESFFSSGTRTRTAAGGKRSWPMATGAWPAREKVHLSTHPSRYPLCCVSAWGQMTRPCCAA